MKVHSGCNRSYSLSMNLTDITILSNKNSDYHCIISLICKNETVKLMQNTDLTEKKWSIVNWEKCLNKFEGIYKNGRNRYLIWWYWYQKTKISPI